MNNKVELKIMNFVEVMDYRPSIPAYQRVYCWEEDNVIQLLDNLLDNSQEEYRLGSIILNNSNGKWDIVDGQQRLVTLTLLLRILGTPKRSLPLLKENFVNTDAKNYIKYNYMVINNYLQNQNRSLQYQDIMEKVTFSVLLINSENLDLAFTFFSNTNSRGVGLSDYDLLKAHHLRYVPYEEQQRHLAKRWNEMVLSADKSEDIDERNYVRALEVYIFCLRKWLRKDPVNEWQQYHVKNEYQSAAIIDEIPPFCEQFQYKEPIQGGSHFFGYVEHFVTCYEHFRTTNVYEAIHSVGGESHWWFRDVIEANLFAYYLKFGEQYLPEALILTTRLVSQIRFNNQRVYRETLLNSDIGNLEITQAIDQATSPTFFLADVLNKIKRLPPVGELKGIRLRYRNQIRRKLNPIFNDFTSDYIKKFFTIDSIPAIF